VEQTFHQPFKRSVAAVEAAAASASLPRLFLIVLSALSSSRVVMVVSLSRPAAYISGVSPSLSSALTSPPRATSNRSVESRPCCAAICIAVCPSPLPIVKSAWLSSRNVTQSSCPTVSRNQLKSMSNKRHAHKKKSNRVIITPSGSLDKSLYIVSTYTQKK
jgi:hypothetical protein